MDIYEVNEVFTPTQPARKNFVKREQLDRRLQRALKTPGMQVVLYGHSGSGKTTLLLNKLKELKLPFVKTNCTANMTFDDLLSNVYLKLEKELSRKEIDKENQLGGGKIGIASIVSFDSSNSTENISEKSFVSPYSSIELSLSKAIGEIGSIWVIEDFHKLEVDVKSKLAQLMKVFMDLSDEYQKLKIVALGAKNTAREVVELDSEMLTRVSEIYVPLMNNDEICKIVENGSNLLNISVKDYVVKDVVEHSHGVASICHQLCLLMCESSDLDCTDEYESDINLDYEDFNYAASEYIQQVSDTLKSAFQKAMKVEHSDKILSCLAENDIDGVEIPSLVEYINENFDDVEISKENIQEPLLKLSNIEHGSVLMYHELLERYSFKDPFYKLFAKLFLKETLKKKKLSASEVTKLFNKLILTAKREYSNPNDSFNGVGDALLKAKKSDIERSETPRNKFEKTKPRISREI